MVEHELQSTLIRAQVPRPDLLRDEIRLVIPLRLGEHPLGQPHRHLEGVGPVVVVAAGEVAQLLDQQPGARQVALWLQDKLLQ